MGAEDEFEEMRKLIDRLVQDAVEGKATKSGRADTGGDRRKAPRASRATPRRFIVRIPPAPLPPDPEVSAGRDAVYVTWDLFETKPTSVSANVSGRLLLIELDGPRPRQRVVELPHDVERDARWTLRNGVLDLVLTRRKDMPRG